MSILPSSIFTIHFIQCTGHTGTSSHIQYKAARPLSPHTTPSHLLGLSARRRLLFLPITTPWTKPYHEGNHLNWKVAKQLAKMSASLSLVSIFLLESHHSSVLWRNETWLRMADFLQQTLAVFVQSLSEVLLWVVDAWLLLTEQCSQQFWLRSWGPHQWTASQHKHKACSWLDTD